MFSPRVVFTRNTNPHAVADDCRVWIGTMVPQLMTNCQNHRLNRLLMISCVGVVFNVDNEMLVSLLKKQK